MSGSQAPLLLAIVELGAYPDFTPLYRELGYRVETLSSGRRANARLKEAAPAVLVTEFNYESNFRDRTSALESTLAVAQRWPQCRVIVFFQAEEGAMVDTLHARFPFFLRLAYPIREDALRGVLLAPP